MSFPEPKTPVTHEEAREIAKRYIDMQFRNEGERPRATIPVNLERDDDVRLCAYIRQNAARITELEAEVAKLRTERDEARNKALDEAAAWHNEQATNATHATFEARTDTMHLILQREFETHRDAAKTILALKTPAALAQGEN